MNQMVKQERHDEAEIAALAAKMLEANKSKNNHSQLAKNSPVQGQSMNILNFMQSDKGKAKNANSNLAVGATGSIGTPNHLSATINGNNNNNTSVSNNNTNSNNSNNGSGNCLSQEQRSIDEESLRGRFGWTSIGKVHIPYIMRNNEHYVAVRMVEMKLLNKYLSYLHQDIYNCTCVRSYYITEAEARVLNEVNFRHCDYQFGREQFTLRDLIVRLSDAHEFYKFLSSCYSKLVNGETSALDRCGFIRINKESVVPYTLYNSQKVVPLFYFEGETDNLKLKADKLEGWDLSYLKFCCKVQGIRNELFAHDSCSVISLNDIKNYFPPGTLFEDYWPKKNVDSQLLISGNTRSQSVVQWTRQPVAPPMLSPSPKPAAQAKPATNNALHNAHLYSSYGLQPITGSQPIYHNAHTQQPPPQPRTVSSARAAAYSANANRQQMRACLYYPNMPQGPPPLIRPAPAQQPQNSYTNSQGNVASNYLVLDPNMAQTNYHQASPTMKTYHPQPLIDVRHMNGGIARYETPAQARYGPDVVDLSPPAREAMGSYGASATQGGQLINQQQAHQPNRTQTPTLTDDGLYNGFGMHTMGTKLVQIPDPPTSGPHIPYKIQKALVEGQMIPCINMKPYVYTELLVTVNDFIAYFFSNIPVQSCEQVMQVLGLDLYKPNNSQMQVLLENGKCQNLQDAVPLVLVRNVIEFMPQLKYMLGTMDAGAKRQRNS